MYEARYDATDQTSHGGISRDAILSFLAGLVTCITIYILALLTYANLYEWNNSVYIPKIERPVEAGESGRMK